MLSEHLLHEAFLQNFPFSVIPRYGITIFKDVNTLYKQLNCSFLFMFPPVLKKGVYLLLLQTFGIVIKNTQTQKLLLI